MLVVAVASLVIGIAAGAGGASDTDETPVASNSGQGSSNEASTATTIASSTVPGTSASVATVATTPSTTQPPTKGWVEVITLSGTSEKRSDNFRLNGGQARLVYKSSAVTIEEFR